MKSNILKYFLSTAAVASCMFGASAQNTYSGYFLEDYTVRHQLNPAFGGTEKAYIGFPALSNMNIAMRGTLHVSDVLYPNREPGKSTILFTNPQIGVKEAMSKFGNHNKIGADVKLDVINVGFKALGGYNTIGINVVTGVNMDLPKSFFSLVKEGVSNRTYDISNLRIGADAYGELALNHSRDLPFVPGLRVGAAVKFLFGLGNVDAYFNKANLTLGENEWTAVTNANVYASVKGLKYTLDTNENTGNEYVSGIDMGSFGLNGFGLGFDLGAVYEWNDFKFSAALLDLGFISYGNTMFATTGGDKTFNTDEYTFSVKDEDGEDKVWDQMKDKISALYELEDRGNIGSRTRALKATLNLAAEYVFPYYKPLHFGFLSSTYFNGPFTWTQVRLSANVKPCKAVSASANIAMGTYGVGFGWLLNLHTKGFNFFVGMDRTLGKLAKQGIPLNSNAEVNLGINFPF